MSAVVYPAGWSSDAIVRSEGRSAGPLFGTPARIGYRPVSSDARDGAHTGAAAYQFVNRAPETASASMCGVRRSSAPQQPRSWQPRSSARKMTKFGRLRSSGAASAAEAAAVTKRSEEHTSELQSRGHL